MKKIIVGAFMVFALFSCNGESNINVENEVTSKVVAENEKIQVMTSIVPLASITNYIGGEHVEVNNLVGVGVSPHGFSLTPQNMINIQKSDIVFLLGIQDIDGFLFKSLSGVKSIALDAGLQVLDSTSEHDHSDHEGEEGHDEHNEHDEEGYDEHNEHEEEGHDEHNEHEEEGHDEHNEHEEEGHDEHNEHEEEGHDEHEYQYILDAQDEVAKGHDHGHSDEIEHEEHSDDDVNKYLADEGEGHVHAESSIDPHVWTGKVNALLIAKKIQEELSKIQPSQADNFEINYNRFEAEIVKVFRDFDTLVEGKNQKEFIVFHDAYNYLLFDAGIDLEKKLIFRSNVMANPGSADMKELTDEVKLHGITSFFVEPQFESKALKLFAGENNGEILELDPLGSSIDAEGFIGNIKSNLEALSNIYE